jgi:hypothetical protein
MVVFLSKRALKQANALSPLHFDFALEYAIRKVQENQVGPKFSGTHQLLVYAGDMNLFGDNIDNMNKSRETLINASKEAGLETNVEKTEYTLLSHYQNAVQNRDIKIANRLFEIVPQFKYLGMTVTNQNLFQEEVKRRLSSGNVCYHSVQNLLSSHMLLKNKKIRIYKTIILPVVLYGCDTWYLTLKEEHGLKVFENRVLRRIFGLKRDEVIGEWRKLHN